MSGLEEEVVYEAVELSEAVFTDREAVFNRDYDGEIEAYMVVQDIRNRIEMGTLDAGEMVYPEELLGFEELGGKEAVEKFYSLEPGDGLEVPDVFFNAGLVEESGGDVFYGENAFPYLVLIDEAKKIFEPVVPDTEVVEPVKDRDFHNAEVTESGEEDQEELERACERLQELDGEDDSGEDAGKVEELSRIWDEVSDDRG